MPQREQAIPLRQPTYADPQDLEFSAAAGEKEERLDAELAAGNRVPPDEPPAERPRAGAKAEPRRDG